MPKNPPKCRRCISEQPLPEQGSQQKGQIESHPQLPPAQGKGAVQPGKKQLQADQKLANPGRFFMQGPEHIRCRTQQNPLQKAAQKALPHQLRRHRIHPRRSRGSS